MHSHKRSAAPLADLCRVCGFASDVGKVSSTEMMFAFPGAAFASSPPSLFLFPFTERHVCGHAHLHKARRSPLKMTALMCFDKFTYQSRATPDPFFSFSSHFFPTSYFCLEFPLGLSITKQKVTIMPPLCLNPNAPVCQRPQTV